MNIKVLGPGCPKCKVTFHNAVEAVSRTGVEAEVQKIEDIMEMMRFNVLTTPVLMINDEALIKGRVAEVAEIVKLINERK